MNEFAQKHCIPCEGNMPPLTSREAAKLLKDVVGWEPNENTTIIRRIFKFKNFKEAMVFTNAVGEIAETEGHHPDLIVKWGSVEILLSTHSIKGLSENDFILAAKIDEIPVK